MEIFGLKITDYSAEGLVALFIILIFLGYWVPRRDRDYWRTAALKSAEQVDKLIESVQPMVIFIKEIKEQTTAMAETQKKPPTRRQRVDKDPP